MLSDDVKRAIQRGWDEMSGTYQSETRISLDDVHYGPISPGERELQLIGETAGKSFLELACGAGQNSIALAKRGGRVTALDSSPKQLRRARALIKQEGVRVDLVRGDMERLAMFKGSSFDVVLSSSGWEFIPDLAACLRGCYEVTRPGGLLIVCTVHPLAAFEWDPDESWLMVTDYFHPPVEVWEDSPASTPHRAMTFFHTVEEMVYLMTSSGFTIERILEPYPYPLSDMSPAEKAAIPYSSSHWEDQYERFIRVPFTIIYTARKPS